MFSFLGDTNITITKYNVNVIFTFKKKKKKKFSSIHFLAVTLLYLNMVGFFHHALLHFCVWPYWDAISISLYHSSVVCHTYRTMHLFISTQSLFLQKAIWISNGGERAAIRSRVKYRICWFRTNTFPGERSLSKLLKQNQGTSGTGRRLW